MATDDRINKRPTSEAENDHGEEARIAGNVRERGQDPSPDDRDRGERSDADPATGEAVSR